jgi:hypothetical protein
MLAWAVVAVVVSGPTNLMYEEPFSYQFTSNGPGPHMWSLGEGGTHAAIIMEGKTCILTGSSLERGDHVISIQVQDGIGRKVISSFNIHVATIEEEIMERGGMEFSNPSPPAGYENSIYHHDFGVSGGSGQYSWSLSGDIPDGLDFSDGVIGGSPSSPGTFNMFLLVSDSEGHRLYQGFTIHVIPDDNDGNGNGNGDGGEGDGEGIFGNFKIHHASFVMFKNGQYKLGSHKATNSASEPNFQNLFTAPSSGQNLSGTTLSARVEFSMDATASGGFTKPTGAKAQLRVNGIPLGEAQPVTGISNGAGTGTGLLTHVVVPGDLAAAPEHKVEFIVSTVGGMDGDEEAGDAKLSPEVVLATIDLAIDADRNGNIEKGETASQDKPFRFWINNDSDIETNKEIEGNTPDYQDDSFSTIRDLEDFQMLKVTIPNFVFTKLLNNEAQLGMKWKSILAGSPSVKVYRASNALNESKDYLWSVSKASSMLASPLAHSLATISDESTAWFPGGALSNSNSGQHPYLLFEGAAKGTGQLCLVLKIGNDTIEVSGVWLKLMDVQEMFQNAQGIPGMPYPNPPDHISGEPARPATGFQNIYWPSRGQFIQDPDETDEVIVHVHGWNMTNPDRRTFSESFFKRLWWKGYKGRFTTFAWPTYNVDDDVLGLIPAHYNKSEYVAWKYGPALKGYVDGISKGSKHVAAHSMGNVVVASALRSGLVVNSYVAMEAALPSGCYDASIEANSYGDFLEAEQMRVTPDLASDLGYRGVMTGISGNFFNFHSANDYALKTGVKFGMNVSWEGNQITYKPNYQLHYHHNSAATGVAKNRIEDSVTLEGNTTYFGRDIIDHHEIMSFIARPRSEALGTLYTKDFTNFDLKGDALKYPFGRDRTEHSGQYQRPIQKTHMFFNTLLDSMDVEFNHLDDSTL